MKLTDFMVTSATVADVQATDKKGVVKELIDSLVAADTLGDQTGPAAVRAVMKRESLGSTGIGRGVAIPHARMDGVDEVIGVLGRSAEGVDFASLDGDPVQIFFLILSPPDKPDPHLKALEHISTVLRDDNFCRFMKQAETPGALNELLVEADETFFS
jgi:PTS system fructose-specific IIA component/PTS system nitrogen regulatory IIA component